MHPMRPFSSLSPLTLEMQKTGLLFRSRSPAVRTRRESRDHGGFARALADNSISVNASNTALWSLDSFKPLEMYLPCRHLIPP
ncbi:hypothetical protein PsYK624_163780 [Phanerochaete sordida]|uniref:Uncharacterized protein n=1 Tax=Phanerochaete sordida TaxID=48140 RepID=A0A9P3GQQ1_9APHY|nr:hypothetical protein PsYK624_163780 [Phanerochaete sordida]